MARSGAMLGRVGSQLLGVVLVASIGNGCIQGDFPARPEASPDADDGTVPGDGTFTDMAMDRATDSHDASAGVVMTASPDVLSVNAGSGILDSSMPDGSDPSFDAPGAARLDGGVPEFLDSSTSQDETMTDGAANASSVRDGTSDAARCDGDSCAPQCGSLARCASSCVDLATDPEHCGKCNHGCGGAACTNASCQPAVVAPRVNVVSFALDASGVYFTTEDNRVLSCPLAGCGPAPQQILSGVPVQEIVTRGDNVIFVGKDLPRVFAVNLYTCPKSGCPSPLPVLSTGPAGNHGYGMWGLATSENNLCYRRWMYVSYGLICCAAPTGAAPDCTTPALTYSQFDLYNSVLPSTVNSPVSIDGDDVFFSAKFDSDGGSTSGLAHCRISTGCAADLEHVTDTRRSMVERAGTLFMSNGSSINSCPASDCSNPSLIVSTKSIATVAEIAVDDAGVYWIESSAGGSIQHCSLPSCVGGPRQLAAALGTPRSLRLQDGFIYWIAPPDLDGDGGTVAGTGAIMRVAK